MAEETLGYADLYVRSAIEQFQVEYAHLETTRDIYFQYAFIDSPDLVASCELAFEADGDYLTIRISVACINDLAKGIDVRNEDENPIFEWRLYWLVFHEIGHWLYGHIPYYAQKGWLTQMGITESVGTPQLHADLSKPGPKYSQPVPLAHAAELQADAFATMELFKLLRRIPIEDRDRYPNELELDIQFCYYSIITVICLFYVQKQSTDEYIFHPSWNLRCLNMIMSLFRAYSRETGLEIGNIIYSDAAIEPHCRAFMEESILITVDGIEEFAADIGLKIRVHDDEISGLYDPWGFLRVLRGATEGSKLTGDLLRAFKNADQLSHEAKQYVSAINFTTQRLQDHDYSKESRSHRFHITSQLPPKETHERVEQWARQNKLDVDDMSVENDRRYEEGFLSLKVTFSSRELMSENDAMSLVNLLISSLNAEIDA